VASPFGIDLNFCILESCLRCRAALLFFMHTPYQQTLSRLPDFEVTYTILLEEGRRYTLPYQGIRWDFRYDGTADTGCYMIWPEFLDREGNVILNDASPVPQHGRAFMWIVSPEMRPIHYKQIETGIRGLFMEGNHKVGVCEVVRLIGLKEG
jgi:hypothetical protein